MKEGEQANKRVKERGEQVAGGRGGKSFMRHGKRGERRREGGVDACGGSE